MNPIEQLRRNVIRDLEELGGRHDEPAIYDGEPGDPGLAGGPGSISWDINGDLGILAVAGMGAIIMEVLHPSVMAGVYTQSTYATQPVRRAQNTLGYVLRTTFGSTRGATAVIERVKRMHGRVEGVRADGVPYRALDPELIAWVHTCIPWAVMTAYDRYRRPLSRDEQDRYLAEQALIGRMAGADAVPESVDELEDFVERIRPQLAYNEQTHDFIRFLCEGTADGGTAPRREAWERRMGICASMSLMPAWARDLTGLHQPAWVERLYLRPTDQLKANVVRWAYPAPPCVAMAERRAAAQPALAGIGA